MTWKFDSFSDLNGTACETRLMSKQNDHTLGCLYLGHPPQGGTQDRRLDLPRHGRVCRRLDLC